MWLVESDGGCCWYRAMWLIGGVDVCSGLVRVNITDINDKKVDTRKFKN